MFEIKTSSHTETNRGSEKSFGIVFSIVFLLVALYPLVNSKSIHMWALILSAIFLIFAIFASNKLIYLNKIWFKFGMLLGSFIAPIVMMLVYLLTVIPTGIIIKLLGKDILRKKLDQKANSYWIVRNEIMGSMKNQY